MTRREVERRKFRQALVPALAVSALAHLVLLGLGAFEIPGWEPTPDRAQQEARAEQWQERSLEVVNVRPAAERSAAGPTSDAASAERSSGASAAAPTVRTPSAPRLAAEPVEVPSVVVALRAEETEERLSASDLAALFPGRSEMPRPTSRAAREASGEPSTLGDQFRGVRGTQRAGARGGGCVLRPGTAINRRFPEDIILGGG